MGIMGCKRSSLNAPGTENPLSHSILKLDVEVELVMHSNLSVWFLDLITLSVHRELVHAVYDAGLLPAWGHFLPARAVWAQQGKRQWLIYTFFCFPCASFVFIALEANWPYLDSLKPGIKASVWLREIFYCCKLFLDCSAGICLGPAWFANLFSGPSSRMLLSL